MVDFPTITSAPAVPVRGSPDFPSQVDEFLNWWAGLPAEMNDFAEAIELYASGLNALATGGALSIDLTFKTATGDSDPGAGGIRLNNATQNAATVLRVSTADDNGGAWADLLDWLDTGTSDTKAVAVLRKKSDPAVALSFAVTAVDTASGYRNLTALNLQYSSASPFANNDDVVLQFTPKGDKGDKGDTGGGVVAQATGFTVTAGADPKTLTVETDFNVANAALIGKQAIWVPAAAMVSRTTNGAAAGSAETTTNDVMRVTKDFDASTSEGVQFAIQMPKQWNEGTVSFKPVWSHPSTTTNFGVVFGLRGVALSNDDALDTAFGTAQTSTDTGGTTDDVYVGPESSAITIAGTPAAEDLVIFEVYRAVSDGSDTMAVDARLHGITLYITTDAGNDA